MQLRVHCPMSIPKHLNRLIDIRRCIFKFIAPNPFLLSLFAIDDFPTSQTNILLNIKIDSPAGTHF